MHSAVFARVTAQQTPARDLGRAKSNRGLDIVYSTNTSDPWVAKIATTADAIAQLRRERAALQYLERWSTELGIPRVLSWDDAPGEVCLIQTKLPGTYRLPAFRADASIADLMKLLGPPLQWVKRFAASVQLPEAKDTASLARQWAERIALHPDRQFIPPGLPALLAEEAGQHAGSAVAIHGDYFHGNVAYGENGASVFDWEGFGPGFPLQDAFSYVVNSHYYADGREYEFAEKYRHVFFSNSSAMAIIRKLIAESGLSNEAARLYFYCYFATQLSDKGLRLDDWAPLLRILDAAGYPAPGKILA